MEEGEVFDWPPSPLFLSPQVQQRQGRALRRGAGADAAMQAGAAGSSGQLLGRTSCGSGGEAARKGAGQAKGAGGTQAAPGLRFGKAAPKMAARDVADARVHWGSAFFGAGGSGREGAGDGMSASVFGAVSGGGDGGGGGSVVRFRCSSSHSGTPPAPLQERSSGGGSAWGPAAEVGRKDRSVGRFMRSSSTSGAPPPPLQERSSGGESAWGVAAEQSLPWKEGSLSTRSSLGLLSDFDRSRHGPDSSEGLGSSCLNSSEGGRLMGAATAAAAIAAAASRARQGAVEGWAAEAAPAAATSALPLLVSSPTVAATSGEGPSQGQQAPSAAFASALTQQQQQQQQRQQQQLAMPVPVSPFHATAAPFVAARTTSTMATVAWPPRARTCSPVLPAEAPAAELLPQGPLSPPSSPPPPMLLSPSPPLPPLTPILPHPTTALPPADAAEHGDSCGSSIPGGHAAVQRASSLPAMHGAHERVTALHPPAPSLVRHDNLGSSGGAGSKAAEAWAPATSQAARRSPPPNSSSSSPPPLPVHTRAEAVSNLEVLRPFASRGHKPGR